MAIQKPALGRLVFTTHRATMCSATAQVAVSSARSQCDLAPDAVLRPLSDGTVGLEGLRFARR